MAAPGTGLDKPKLKTDIQSILTSLRNMTDEDFQNHQEIFSERLSSAIDEFVRSGMVITQGTAAAQQGQVI